MNIDRHEWVENYTSYEAVLLCKNTPDQWDSDVAARAFQTFGWNDASTPGNGPEFLHEETGVVVHHDGGVLAIDYGDGKLSQALADLFAVLSALGWRKAEVFHPAETMASLMSDMGKAIPAQMDFDVFPSKATTAISGFAEGASLIARGKAALQLEGVDGLNELALEELSSMTPATDNRGELEPARAPIYLSDDAESIEKLFLQPPVEPAHVPVATGGLSAYEAEQPQTFVLPLRTESIEITELEESVSNLADANVEAVNEVARPSVVEDASTRQQHTPTAIVEKHDQPDTKANRAPRPDVVEPALSGRIEIHGSSQNTVRVGLSVFCFDLPGAQIGDDELRGIAQDCDPVQVVHLRPGAVGELMRWNVLGEMVTAYPWIAERIAGKMGCGEAANTFLASLLLAPGNDQKQPQLRDILNVCLGMISGAGDDMTSSLALLPQQSRKFARQVFMTGRPQAEPASLTSSFAQALEAFVNNFGGLLLAPEGSSFVDVRSPVEDGGGESAFEVFTMSEVLTSPTPRLFVVHLDELDGRSTQSIVSLLHWLANSYASTRRYTDLVVIKDERAEKANLLENIRLKLVNEVGGIMTQLHELGREV